MKYRNICCFLFLILCLPFLVHSSPTVRIKEITSLRGIRENQLMGIGLVTGLAGKGDSSSSAMLKNALANLVSNFGFKIEPDEIKSKNSAIVMVSCEVPPFLRVGDRIDVQVSSIGDARSLEGGVLLQTPLSGANGQVYALAQGRIHSGNAPKTVGSIPGGAIVEQDILSTFITNGSISLILRNPDFVTVNTVAQAIREAFSDISVKTVDASMIEVEIPDDREDDPVGFIADLESLEVTPDASGKVVIDSNTGIIIFGEKVRIGKVAASYQAVEVRIGAYAYNEEEREPHFVLEETATVDDLVKSFQTIGLKTEIIIGLLKAIDRAGSLYGQLIIM